MKISLVCQTFLIAVFLIFVSASALAVEAIKVPQIDTVSLIANNDSYPIIEIRGSGFGQQISQIQVILNNGKVFATVIEVKNKKIRAQLSASDLCTGMIELRVFNNKVASNMGTFLFTKGVPIIYAIEPQNTEPGTIIEVKAENLSCQAVNNLVTLNDFPVPVVGLGNGSLSVRVPDNFSPGTVSLRIIVASGTSLPKTFSINSKPNDSDNGSSSGPEPTMLKFNNNSGIPGAAGFTPMFNIKDTVKTDIGDTASIWDMNFYGTHQAIVKAPWQTTNGTQQLALLSIDCRYNKNLPGNMSGRDEKYVYILVSYPRDPEKPYDPIENPFFWGTLALCSESLPRGEVIYNSLTRSKGGIDSFEISRSANTVSKFSMSATVIALDLGYYYDYGQNFSKAGNGKVTMPKVAKINITLNNVNPRVPVSQFNLGDVTITDESGINGSITTSNTEFRGKLTLDDITFFGLYGIF